jgi:hypothetical protein
MGRKPKPHKRIRLPLTLLEESHKHLEFLVRTGGYGTDKTDAARIIIMRHLHRLERRGKISLYPQNSVTESSDKKE